MNSDLTYLCPSCGQEVRVGEDCTGCPKRKPKKAKRRKAKPARPKRPERSWEQDSIYDDLDLPDEDFDYDEFVAKEFGSVPHRQIGVKWYWWALGIFLLIVMSILGFQLCCG